MKIGTFKTTKEIRVFQFTENAHYVDEDAFCKAFSHGDVVQAWKKGMYEHRGTIHANSIDDAFAIGNIEQELIQPVEGKRPCYSLSVGNILETDGIFYICKPIGWQKFNLAMTMGE
tara:strand:- start:256 stop:603 length:348 start_codon:yes stop_codon:yes gene_type:complete